MKKISKLLLGFLLVWGNAEAVHITKPLQVQHQEPTFVERNTPFELTFKVPGIDQRDVEEAYVFYRHYGDAAYHQKRAALISSNFKTKLLVDDKQAMALEYYFEIHLNNGEKISYPQNSASGDPIRVDIIDQRKSERERRVEETGVDYTILSPDPGNTVAQQDVVVAITLFYDEDDLNPETNFKMLVDGEDVTDQASANDYFYTYSPDNMSSGDHEVRFKMQRPDTTLLVADWNFTVIDPSQAVNTLGSGPGGEGWMPEGNVELSARSQQVGGYNNDALSGNLRLSGRKGDITYSAHGLITTQEDPRLQPQNRFGASLYIGDWLELEAGHVYPTLNPFTIAGQRMQGVDAGFHVWNDALNLQLVYGKLRRGIDNLYDLVEAEEETFQGGQNTVTSYSLGTEDGGNGTFQREVAGGRLGIGRKEVFNFGLNFLKVQDDTSSIQIINDFTDLTATSPSLANNLSEQQKQELENNPEQLSISGNPTPKGNFVAATDLEAHFDNDRIEFQADAAVSLLNQDITEGILTQETAENLGLDLGQDTETLLDQLSWLIIINENMDTLPIRFNTDGAGTSAEPFFPTSILATQSELGLSYFNNDLKVRYRWIGPSYNSLANSTVRKDIAGFNVSDRFRLWDNRIYVTLGYENLNNNVINNQDATTSTITYRGNVSWYPVNQNLPRVSLGIMQRSRDNQVGLNNPLVAAIGGVPESAAVRNLEIQNGDTLTTPTPRLSDTYQFTASVSQRFSFWGITHNASVNYSLLNTTDQVFNFGDSQSNSLSMTVVNQYKELPLQTNLGFNINNTQTASGLTDIQILGASLGGSIFFFDDKLSVDMSLAYTQNRSETTSLITDDNGTPQEANDDYYKPGQSNDNISVSKSNSYVVSAGARYNLNDQHSFLANFRYSNVRNTLSTVAIPNDHLLQVRYIFNF